MVRRFALFLALALGLVSAVSADIPWPQCLPCPSKPPASNNR
jgi:hypothetical protein